MCEASPWEGPRNSAKAHENLPSPSDLVKSELLTDFCELWPERFNNKTNRVTPRRWMLHANPRLTRHISPYLGPGWIDEPELGPARASAGVRRRRRFPGGPSGRQTGQGARPRSEAKKREVAELVRRRGGVQLPPEAMLVVHIKRIQEYKRQLLACLNIVTQYAEIWQLRPVKTSFALLDEGF